MPLNRNLPNNRTNDSLLITLADNLGAVTKLANCVDTSTNLLKVDIEDATIEAENLATKENQQTVINATLRDINNTGSIGDGSSQATALSLGYDRINGKGRALLVDSDGHLQVDVLTNVGSDTRIKGNDGNDGSGTDRIIKTDGNGAVIVDASKEGLVLANGTTTALHNMMLGNSDGTNLRTLKCDADGHLQVDILSGAITLPSGAATEAKQDVIEATLTAIETDIAALEVLQTTIAGDTTSIDGKITACNTGAVVVSSGAITETNSTAILSDTASLDSKITACNTGAVVIASGTISLPTGAATEATLSASEAHLGTIDTSTAGILASHYADGDTFGATDTGVVVMGRNGTNLAKPIHITNNGDVEVEIADFVKGQAASAASFPVVIASDNTVATSSTQLPASLGQKANSGSISVCRSTTAGAFDMSARTTIGTASTTTKLLCDSSGKLAVNANLSGIGFSSELTIMDNQTIADGANATTSVARLTSITSSNPQPTFSITATADIFDAELNVSQDNSSFEVIGGISAANSPKIVGLDSFEGAATVEYYKITITNNSGGSAEYTVKAGGVGLTMAAP
jgi:hypothetical protein